ncbi:hypothetical protein [Agaribacterium haliotis]|uniref:hypothetical protein n=1 Tax=Agaribacterium haliotis TaxID=2013869 RepID=UPI000BB568BF|nr:hypothetical protein [Agaribacterium haliotis]
MAISDKDRIDLCIETLSELPIHPIQESRLVLMYRLAMRQRALIESCTLLNSSEFIRQAKGTFELAINDSSLLENMCDEKSVLYVVRHGGRLFPKEQICKEKFSVFPQIQHLLKRALNTGYSSWEILDWLVSPSEIISPAVAGRPLDYKSQGELLEAIQQIDESRLEPTFIPIALLHQQDFDRFDTMLNQWLPN